MIKFFAAACAVLLALSGSSDPAAAHGDSDPKIKAAKVRYGGAPGRGYWRPGPKRGPGFGFSTYKGDPFGDDDYYDGDRCYYVHHKNYCVKRKIFTGLRDIFPPHDGR